MHLIDRQHRGFTLVELLVVVAMIAIILGSLTTSFSAAQARARVQKAAAEVKVITQAILGYENWARGGKFELPTMENADASSGSLSFLLGKESAESGGRIPLLLQAQLQGEGKICDPWGTPYRITIREHGFTMRNGSVNSLKTGYYLPNFYRINNGGAR